MRGSTKLREMLATGKTFLVPGAYDGISARIVQAAGAEIVYATGGGIARSTGIPDMGMINPVQVTERLTQMVDAVEIGEPESVLRTTTIIEEHISATIMYV